MCIFTESSSGPVTELSCYFCCKTIKGVDEINCDPFLTEKDDGSPVMICEACARRRFSKKALNELRRLSDPINEDYRTGILDMARDRYLPKNSTEAVTFCPHLESRIAAAKRDQLAVA